MTTKIVMVCIEDVLADGYDLKRVSPQKWARPLYDGLRTQFRMVALTGSDQGIAHWWLNRENFPGWASVLSWNMVASYEDWRVDQIREFMANGWEIAFLLDTDVSVIERASEMGILTLRLQQPRHWPGWKAEDATPFQPWDEIQSRVETSP